MIVGKGAVLGLGWNAPEGTLGPDTVGENIIAYEPLALQVGNVTVNGNLVSYGGGVLSTSVEDFRNFPVKDNTIHGNLIVQGWHGGWIGLIRNQVGKNVIFTNERERVEPSRPDPGRTRTPARSRAVPSGPSSSRGPIGGNLICFGNVPAAQVNQIDAGDYNFVGGKGIGECAGLTQ